MTDPAQAQYAGTVAIEDVSGRLALSRQAMALMFVR
jgi:hypothetical protein